MPFRRTTPVDLCTSYSRRNRLFESSSSLSRPKGYALVSRSRSKLDWNERTTKGNSKDLLLLVLCLSLSCCFLCLPRWQVSTQPSTPIFHSLPLQTFPPTMKSAAVLLALAAGASAFTTRQPARSTSVATNAVIDEWDGAIDLRGKEFKFDPVRHYLICRCDVCGLN